MQITLCEGEGDGGLRVTLTLTHPQNNRSESK